MKKLAFFLLIIIMLGSLIQFAYAENKPEAVNDNKRMLIIGGDKNFPPYEFVDDDGEYRGFNVDLMRALALELGVEVKLQPMEWLQAHRALQSQEIDAVQGMNFNKQREEIYNFSTPFLLNSSVIFVKKDTENISQLRDLMGMKVAVQRSDAAAYILAEIGEIEVMFFSDLEVAFSELTANRIDAVVGNRLTGLHIMKQKKLNNMKIVGGELNQTDYGIAVKKGNEELLKELNDGLQRLKKNGTYNKIYEKWFGKEDVPPWKNLKYITNLLFIVLLVTGSIILISFKWNQSLKKKVILRTQELDLINKELETKQKIIKDSDEFKQQIIDSLRVGLITFDKQCRVTALNSMAESIFNINRTEIIGKSLQELGLNEYFNKEDIDNCIEYNKGSSMEERVFNIGGREYIYSYLISPLEGNLLLHQGGVLTFRNITEEKKLRDSLAQKDKMQSLGRLVAGIAHEIRNPLTSIKTYIELLPTKYDNRKFRDNISLQIPQEISRLNILISDLLDYAKPKKMKKQSFLLNELIINTVELFKVEFDKNSVNIAINCDSSLTIYADKQQIKQVVINLLLNSAESIADNGSIEISGFETSDKTYLVINDNGKGIDEKDADKILEPFYTTKSNGTGLGLSLCYQYIKENDGEITIDSKKGIGTKVKLVFNKKDREVCGYEQSTYY
ncbi:transporter substrate-binding domain-containing protein [Alkaliphilus peptidifermentans]|uniref:histidine kinase n=1 Tax=Alkaliphilus peptidifermentans DSM 18978 TaxID=1120976 RepID=A0A1G5AF78_9FIRM|nr:transporter substrate-binding domain-containing protein [Alkaliphilus peptidifermentans]SCX76528.1 polar amino acid transport system substrate-binding protein [Alkaliphilus peptidifermentans DSM 18978]